MDLAMGIHNELIECIGYALKGDRRAQAQPRPVHQHASRIARMELTIAGDIAVELATKDDLDRHHERLRDVLAGHKDARYYMVSGATACFVIASDERACSLPWPRPRATSRNTCSSVSRL